MNTIAIPAGCAFGDRAILSAMPARRLRCRDIVAMIVAIIIAIIGIGITRSRPMPTPIPSDAGAGTGGASADGGS